MTDRAACTIITKAYLAHARALANSLTRHNPGLRLYVLLADRVDGSFDASAEPFTLVELSDLGDAAAVRRMSFYYSPFEFCCALRGLLHRYMFEKTQLASWLFLDSDIHVCHNLDAVFAELDGRSILLSLHARRSSDDPRAEIVLLRSGVFNAGFLGVSRGAEARAFVDWFTARLERYALNGGGYFVDQLWLNLAPLFFSRTAMVNHPGVNLGHWNLSEHRLSINEAGSATADGEPVLFAHFSGAELGNENRVSIHAPKYDGRVPEAWKLLFRGYEQDLRAAALEQCRQLPYAFDRFNDGSPVTAELRRLYYDDCALPNAGNEDPFAQGASFRRRLLALRRRGVLDRFGRLWRGGPFR